MVHAIFSIPLVLLRHSRYTLVINEKIRLPEDGVVYVYHGYSATRKIPYLPSARVLSAVCRNPVFGLEMVQLMMQEAQLRYVCWNGSIEKIQCKVQTHVRHKLPRK